jgi:tripartite-type tricarboxylate transporter receptor subunit TctC
MRGKTRTKATLIVAAASLLGCAPAFADSVEEFYKGKRLEIVVGAGAGGVFDFVARSLARNIVEHIPGRPVAIVQNMPGAGSLKAAEWAARIAPRDGATIVGLFAGAILQPLLEPQRIRFDPRQLNWLGSADSGPRICVTFQHSKARTFDDARAHGVTLGATAAGGSTWDYAQILRRLAGLDMKLVAGYKGTPDLLLAMERGEIDGMCGYSMAALRADKPDWFRDKRLNFIVQFSHAEDKELNALGAARISRLVSGERAKAAELIMSQQLFTRPYAAPPGVPPERVAALRTAFERTVNGAAMRAEFEKINSPLEPIGSQKLEDIIKELYATPQPILDLARQTLKGD